MSFNANLENMQNLCRICLKDGDVNIWTCKVTCNQDAEIYENMGDTKEKSFFEIMNIFVDGQNLLNFTDDFPLLCQQCLEDLKFCYSVHERIKLANVQVINLYQETLNQYIEEEHLVETVEETNAICAENSNVVETLIHYPVDNVSELTSGKPKNVSMDKNNSFIVTQFIPETLMSAKACMADQSDSHKVDSEPAQHLLTVNLKAVEVQNLENIDRIKTPPPFTADTSQSAIYVCQYCPQAFTKPEYLKTHIQKSHVCKFCTQPFSITEDLYSHIREIHTENKCAVCHKLFSSSTNLRHHIKRVHGIKLPAKVTLIDFVPSETLEEKSHISEAELFETMPTQPDIDHLWQSDNCIDMLDETAMN